MCNIPVLPVAASILDKYKDVAECTGKLLPVFIIRKTKNSSFKNEKSKKEVDVAITVSNKDIV